MRGRALSDDSPRNVEGAAVSINQSWGLLLMRTDCSDIGRLEAGCCTAVSHASSLWLVESLSNWKSGWHNTPWGCPKFPELGIIGYPSVFTAQPGIMDWYWGPWELQSSSKFCFPFLFSTRSLPEIPKDLGKCVGVPGQCECPVSVFGEARWCCS